METTKKKPIHISIDEDLKKDAEQLFDELGMNMTTAITVFLKQSVTKQAIHFKIERGNPATLQAIKDGNIHGGFSSVDELLEDLGTSGK
ncbi:putative DNA-damage-inducible protein J [Enterococcus mundtii 3F]|uniref:type II toxin-antitoxin system RelB/DinJ family antitoxin n=1 Tax=Enterococcus mundtii TaxID=53346 RepID=UPI002304B67E|nr:type II toxin-antitoxin system RelB/DinJ family antitoxin [Enterococcus mundtii]MDA9460959.1 putative DNA-damage-inducible protein J [Enterococcus mundtii 3F]